MEGVERIPLKLVVREKDNDNLRERYGGVSGSFVLEGELLRPAGEARQDMVGVFMHPTAATTMLPLPLALAKLGMHICVASSRYPNNDSLLYAENIVLDLGRFLYQSQAENATITHTPTGRPVDLRKLIPADMLILVAAHCGRASYLTEALDPTIWLHQRSASDPLELQSLRIYGINRVKAPFSAKFLDKYRTAQKERSQRITEWARSVPPETPVVIHGTMADPRWLDLTIDPNDRPMAGKCFLGDCEAANDMPTGLARFTTAGSWLSQWAEGVSELDALRHLPSTNVPTLVITNGGDDGVPASHGTLMFNAIKHHNKKMENIEKAAHYYIVGNPPRVQKAQLLQCASIISNFIGEYSTIPLDVLRKDYAASEWKAENFVKVKSRGTCGTGNGLPDAPRATGFNHVAMVSSNMAATVQFYSGILGFPLVKTLELPGGGQHFFFDCGDCSGGMLAFFWWPETAHQSAPGIATASKKDMEQGKIPTSVPGSLNHIAFDYPEEGLDALRERLLAAGIWVSPKLFHANNEIGFALNRDDPDIIFVSVYLWGPDGELIEFSTSTQELFTAKLNSRVKHKPMFPAISKL